MVFKVKVYKNSSFMDKRGYYWTSWKKDLIKNLEFKHDKFSLSKKNVLRGLHGDNNLETHQLPLRQILFNSS